MTSEETHSATPDAVELALQIIEPALTSGLTEEQSVWARDLYRRRLLPTRLSGGTYDNPDAEAIRIRSAAEYLRGYLDAIGTEKKLSFLNGVDLFDRLSADSNEAFALAQKRAAGTWADSLADRARQLARRFEDFGKMLASAGDDVPDFVSEELSEATLDAAYALEGGDIMSLRLGRHLKFEQGIPLPPEVND